MALNMGFGDWFMILTAVDADSDSRPAVKEWQ